MRKDRRYFKKWLRFSTVGLELGFSVLLGLYAGERLDAYWGTAPWMLLLGLGLGSAAGFRAVYRLLKAAVAENMLEHNGKS